MLACGALLHTPHHELRLPQLCAPALREHPQHARGKPEPPLPHFLWFNAICLPDGYKTRHTRPDQGSSEMSLPTRVTVLLGKWRGRDVGRHTDDRAGGARERGA